MKNDETKEQGNKSQPLRRMSFTSSSIAMGCLPEQSKLRETVIQALVSFSSKDLPTKEQVCKELVPIFLKIDRMRGIPAIIDKKWVFDPCKNINNDDMVRELHVDCDTVQGLGDEAQNLVQYEVRSPDRNLPWWEFVLLRNHSGVLDESMLVLRVDHAIGDGLSIGKLCTKILKFEDGSVVKDLIPAKMRLGKKDSEIRAKGKGIWSWFRMLRMIITAALKVALLPLTQFDHSIVFAKGVVGKYAKDTRQRKMIIFDQVPLDFVRAIKTKADMSLNDVLVVALSQAIHDFCRYNDCQIFKKHGTKVNCRAIMTYGFPSNHDDHDGILHNRWVPLSLCLGVGHLGIAKRVQHVKRGTSELKETPIARFQMALQELLPFLPTSIFRKIVHMVYSRHTLSCTNVPGPEKRIIVLGKPVTTCRFSVGHIHSVLSILSFNGMLNITLCADDEAIPGVQYFAVFYMKALVAIAEEYNVAIPESVKVAAAKPLVSKVKES